MKLPAELGLSYPSWRPGQQLAIRTALSSKTPFVAISAPTGSGKSVIAAALTKLDPRRQVVLTGTKQLQGQYASLFPHLYDIRGMGNYECLAAKDEFKLMLLVRGRYVTCEDGPCRADIACSLKDHGCLYFDRYRSALASPAVLTSYAYWLSMRRFGKGLGAASRLICDEAHQIPSLLSQAWRIEIPYRTLARSRAPHHLDGWRQWAAMKLDALKASATDNSTKVRARRDHDRYQQLLTHLDSGWVWEPTPESWVFEPVQVAPLASLLWDKQTQVVFLSATLTPASLQFLGVRPEQLTMQVLKSRFPLESHPVYVLTNDGVRLDARTVTDQVIAKWLDCIDRIIDKRLDRKGIIHTVSYTRQQQIAHGSRHKRRFIVPERGSLNLARAIEEFKSAEPGTVLVSPSVITGVDFPYSECEYQIISKVPFPDTRSAIMKARISQIPKYRESLTMQQIVQAAGRGMRAEDDQCETFIIDTHANWFLNRACDFAPRDFLDSVSFERSIPAPPKALTMPVENRYAKTT
jgi:Rad3-related DNA helicase